MPDLFTTAAAALMAWIGPLPVADAATEERVSISADDKEDLLVRWLQEILGRFHLRHAYLMAVRDIGVNLERNCLQAVLVSRAWDESASGDYQEVKAVTYHQIKVEQQESLWVASVILDI